jgi:CheY-like chemotaxis protein
VAVPPLLAAAIDTMASAAEAKRVTIHLHADEIDAMVIGDRARLQQVCWNLLSNAVKFTPGGGCIDVETRIDADQVVISVSDTGIGIDPAFLPAVFDRFRQADTATTRLQGGLGLGLAITRHLIELHGGHIEAHSPGLGQGATFIISLPRLQPDDDSPASAGSATANGTGGAHILHHGIDLHGVRVLVVDDDADARELVGVILNQAGARPSLAGGTSAALDLMAGQPPFDAVICDLAMPDQDGYALIAAIRAGHGTRYRHLPAIAFTANAGPPDDARARNAGFDAILTKPIESWLLIDALVAVLRRRARAARS